MYQFDLIGMKSTENVLFSIWQKRNVGKEAIEKYIEISKNKLAETQKRIDRFPEKTIVWGVGALTRRLLLTTNLKSKTLFFIDSNPNLIGKSIDGIQIHSPNVLEKYHQPVFIASFRFRDEVIKYMKSKQYGNPILTIE